MVGDGRGGRGHPAARIVAAAAAVGGHCWSPFAPFI